MSNDFDLEEYMCDKISDIAYELKQIKYLLEKLLEKM